MTQSLLTLRGVAASTVLLLVLLCSSLPTTLAQQKAAIYASIFNTSVYDTTIRPNLNNNLPVIVDVNYRLNLLYSVSAQNEVYSIDLYVRESWLDDRLQFDSSLWPVDSMGPLRIPGGKIWKPDTFFYNAISCATSDELVTLAYDGTVKWSRHMTCTFHANFYLIDFPFDSQSFDMERLSFAYSQQELQLIPTPALATTSMNPNPIATWENSLWDLQSVSCTTSLYNFRAQQPPYTEVKTTLNIQRKSASYILKMILPMFVVVCLSTLTYWIDCNSPPARVGGTITLVLSIITFNLVVSGDLPKINYSTMLDWYVWKCFLFVLFAVAEFAFVNHTLTSKQWPSSIALLTDDFCQWTILPTWLLSNLLYWPILNNTGGSVMIALIEVSYFIGNLYRIYWNYKNDTRGMAIPVRRLLHNGAAWWRQRTGHQSQNVLIGLRHEDDPSLR